MGVSYEWETIYRAAFPRVYRALVATLGDRTRAEDALQDAFVAGLERPPADDRNVAGWLFRVALRKAGRQRMRWLPLTRVLSPGGDGEIEALLARLETGRLLALLTERQRAIVLAHYYLGLTHAATAQLFGIQTGTVSATISKALDRMRGGATSA